jgi:Flp pilus assembly protein TadD
MAQELCARAAVLFQSGCKSDAVICLHKARLFSPGSPEILHALGDCLNNLGQTETASIYYLEALDGIGNRLTAIGNYEISIGHYPGYLCRKKPR